MSWQEILGHDDVVEQFRRALTRGRLASSFLFVGPQGIGKRTFAVKLAAALLCETRPEEALDPCGTCPACAQVAAGTHPDLEIVSKPKDRATIPLDLLVGDKEHRGHQGLCHHLALKPYRGGRKIALIDDADYLNPEGANSLLKTLEEPPPRSVLILVGTSPARQLPTIRSRCQMIRFFPLPADAVAELLVARELIDDPEQAWRLAERAGGSIERALQLAAPELWTFRGSLYGHLVCPVLDSVRASREVAAFVDEAGKQPAARRARLRQVMGFAIDFYRHLLRAENDSPPSADAELRGFVEESLRTAPADPEQTAARLARCLEAAEQIDRNANQSTLIETWLDDLARGDA